MDNRTPKHVAIVMDGNGRWALKQGLARAEGHRAGAEAVKAVIRGCVKHAIPVLSLFAFSSENWTRPEQEVSFLMQLFLKSLEKEVAELHQNGVCLRFTGCRENLSQDLQQQMQKAERLTLNNNRLILNIVINYGGRWDIVEAAKAIAAKVKANEISIADINEQVFGNALSMNDLPEPDLFIRTSGEQRISNFFLWQMAYTELYFTEVLWPDFTLEEFEGALSVFANRERRYGKTSQQLAEF
ncbi:polyprenyl diphosphate synthase [Legionella dresdenensis]|uniref:Ditrans,polycis-undecaprenyl-diphosphate synthase ((2E,6E)-farnesyl-diphosphate specific) n=1 Tax=Legionella dresdenensis TaxID=450200 RepID=A0ABV8CHF4_9GAMM